MSNARHRRSGGLAAPLAVATSTGAAALVAALAVGGLQQGDGSPAPHSGTPRSPDLVLVEPAGGPSHTTTRGSRSGGATPTAATLPAGVRSGTQPRETTPPEPATTAAASTTHRAHPSHPAHPTQAATSPSRPAPPG